MNNITKVLEVLGEKISSLESDLYYKNVMLEEAQKKNVELSIMVDEYRARMGSTSTEAPKDKEW